MYSTVQYGYSLNRQRTVPIPYDTVCAEQRKFDNDDNSLSPVRTAGHTLVPFVMEDGGRSSG